MQIRTQPYLETLPGLSQHLLLARRVQFKQLEFSWHYHPEIEIIFFPRGKGFRYVGHSIERIEEGDLCVLGKNLPHTWKSSAQPNLEVFVIQFLPQLLEGVLQNSRELAGVRQMLEASAQGLTVEGRERDRIGTLMRKITKLPTESWRRPTLLLELLGTLSETALRPLQREMPVTVSDSTGGPALRTILNYVHRNFSQKIDHGQVAREVRMSPHAFSRFFQRHMGKNFSDYVNEVRLMGACNDLIETERSITEIAFKCGYNNLAYFNRRFKALWGRSPRDYRRPYRERTAVTSHNLLS